MNKKTRNTITSILLILVIVCCNYLGIDIPISITDVVSGTATPIEQKGSLDLLSNQKVEDVAVPARLVRVVDGDTLVVIEGGQKKRVRLIGVDTPESVHPDKSRNTTKGIKASEYTKNLLKDTSLIYLVKDSQDLDRYGRELRYVWLDKDANVSNVDDVKTKMLNGILLVDGVAKQKEYKPNTSYTTIFKTIVLSAKL